MRARGSICYIASRIPRLAISSGSSASPATFRTMKIVSWNVNGLRAVLHRRFGTLKSLLSYLKAGQKHNSHRRRAAFSSGLHIATLHALCRCGVYTRNQAVQSRYVPHSGARRLRRLVRQYHETKGNSCSSHASCAALRDSYFSFCKIRGGYAGVATFCNSVTAQPVAAEDGMCGIAPLPPQNSTMGDNARICFPAEEAFWQG